MEEGRIRQRARAADWMTERVLVDGGPPAIEQARAWALALGVELVASARRGRSTPVGADRVVTVPRTFRPARVRARLVVVDATDGHVRWRVRRTVAPLVIARPHAHNRRIVVATNLTAAPNDDPTLDFVAPYARAVGAHVTLVHSIEASVHSAEWMATVAGSAYDFVGDETDDVREAARKQLADRLARHRLEGDVRITDGEVTPTVLRIADELDPELIAVGAPHPPPWRHLFPFLSRSVAEDVSSGAETSVLIVPHERHGVDLPR
jgi:nucleotide-binding universal stress UspA family protein